MLLLLFVALTVCSAQQSISYDDLALKKCDSAFDISKNTWSIHGLWPEYDQKTWPQFCDPTRYKDLTEDVMAQIVPLMKQYWFSCGAEADSNNWSFWVHEWQKHGTCQPLPPAVYFRRTIDLFLEAQKNNWYGCSTDNATKLLLHVDKVTLKWTGKC